MILNRQSKYAVSTSRLQEYLVEVEQALHLGRRECNVCLVDDRQIRRLNSLYRGKERATDVLSFAWDNQQAPAGQKNRARRTPGRNGCASVGDCAIFEFENFLGDIVISVETAKRNAHQEGHSTLNEIRWLILHGLLHLLGYDHESDQGEMAMLELSLRRRLGI